MPIKNKIFLMFAKQRLSNLDKERKNPVLYQDKIFTNLINKGKNSIFGSDHDFKNIKTIDQFKSKVPIREYNDFKKYLNHIIREGKDNVLWPGRMRWMAQSSGTSSTKSKYLPITKDALENCHYSGIQNMLATYINLNPKSRLFDGKALTLGGAINSRVKKNKKQGIEIGDLSGIMLKKAPWVAEFVRSPKKEIALISDFNKKVDLICKSCSNENITSISGVPSWNLLMLRKVLEYNSVNNIHDLWPNLELFMHGGISMEPYWSEYLEIFNKEDMHYMENYNASEGYFAFQDDPNDKSMLLCCNNSVFYEFIPMESLDKALAGEFHLTETIETVKTEIPYAMVITTNAGLWRYLIGDTIIFKSLYPHKIKIVGRTQLFINAFGEELMISNAEEAMNKSCLKFNAQVLEYTVAPIFMSNKERGGHEWIIEFQVEPDNLEEFADYLDIKLCRRNSDYEAKRKSNIINKPKIVSVKEGTFFKWMEEKGKVGGQNKVPRLSNNRDIVNGILELI